jgi:hypothetical protein
MNVVRGRVHDGHVEIETQLPEGAEVVVLVPDNEEPFDLDDPDLAELEKRIAEAEGGDVELAKTVFDRIRPER